MLSAPDSARELNGSETPSRVSALSIARMVWTRRWLVLSIWLLGSGLTIGIVRSLPAIYRAEAVVLVDSQKIPESFVSSTVRGDVADRLALITQNIMTSSRLLDIVNSFGLYREERSQLTQEELLRRMRDDISVSFEKSWTGDRSQAFRLGYQGRDRRVVAAVTNRLARLYVEENVRSRENQAEGTVDFLRRQLREAKDSLDEQERKVAQFKQQYNGALPEQQSSLLGTLSSLSMQLEGTQSAIARSEENKLSLQAALAAAESSEAALKANLERQLIASAQTGSEAGAPERPKSEILEEQLRQLRIRYSPQHPDVQRLEQRLSEAKQEESQQTDRMQHAVPGDSDPKTLQSRTGPRTALVSPELLQTRERIATLRAQIEVARRQTESFEKERQQLTGAIADCQARINRLPLVEQQMAGLKRNYEESANNYKSLLQKQLAAGMATDMERSQKSEGFTVIDAARLPEKPVKPKRPLLAFLGCAASLILSLGVALGLELRKGRFLGEWELPAGTAVLGRVPMIHMAQSVTAGDR